MDISTPKIHLPAWLQAIVASAGGLGLFLIAFLDSSVLTFPVINDLLLIDLSVRYPARMQYYAAMATLGSVGGCLLLYYIARKFALYLDACVNESLQYAGLAALTRSEAGSVILRQPARAQLDQKPFSAPTIGTCKLLTSVFT